MTYNIGPFDAVQKMQWFFGYEKIGAWYSDWVVRDSNFVARDINCYTKKAKMAKKMLQKTSKVAKLT